MGDVFVLGLQMAEACGIAGKVSSLSGQSVCAMTQGPREEY